MNWITIQVSDHQDIEGKDCFGVTYKLFCQDANKSEHQTVKENPLRKFKNKYG